jgi:predicted ribosome quality control (RQC) complex YloA/Tae2 family protein
MNYYELIYLLKEFKTKLSNCWVEQAVTPFKNQLEVFMSNEEESFRLIFNGSPGNAALFLDSYRPAKKSNTQQFFEAIHGQPIKGFTLIENERMLFFDLENGKKLWFKLFGNSANVFLTDGEVISETFKDRDSIGERISMEKGATLFEREWDEQRSIAQNIRKQIPLFPKAWIEVLSDYYRDQDFTPAQILDHLKKIDHTLRVKVEPRILENGTHTIIPFDLLPLNHDQSFERVNDLVRYRFKNYAHDQRLNQQKNEVLKALKRQIKRGKSSLNNLYQADKGLEKAETYEQYGHILMANAHLGKPDSGKMTFDDLYHAGEQVSINLEENKTIAENAQKYYSRSSNSLKSYEEALERIPKLEHQVEKFEQIVGELEGIKDLRDLQDWKKENKTLMEEVLPGSGNTQSDSSPFHEFEHKGYTLWIGKNARNNDLLVQTAHKEDVWLHARGVAGSHVIIRMNNNKNMPDMTLIEEVAGFAAYQSKAKGSQLSPVIYTKKKYVRKPKGAAPGAVIVQKENVIIVEPVNPFK